jgi:hypothetical protein
MGVSILREKFGYTPPQTLIFTLGATPTAHANDRVASILTNQFGYAPTIISGDSAVWCEQLEGMFEYGATLTRQLSLVLLKAVVPVHVNRESHFPRRSDRLRQPGLFLTCELHQPRISVGCHIIKKLQV